MTETFHRYPGAQPFRDDEFSRRTFFGREPASMALTDQILANRLVIVYAKSGLGKTSLLNAGVAPRLRDAGSLPLFVRLNDIEHGPLYSVLEGVRAEAERQKVEYVAGDTSSLWSFFKTVEFWRDDLLLTPVLIIDQFEELFTLQSEEAREQFLSELSYLVRGVPPPSQLQAGVKVDEAPPPIRLVLSLREDFLGLLEEASDHIPEIMDHRYRLAPLSYEMASEAITGPAAIENRKIATKVFRLEPALVISVLNYLTRSTSGGHSKQHVEPFHLQLICQRIEKVAALKQQASKGEEVVLSFKDIGGEAALSETLESFYSDAIQSLPTRSLRKAARLLCEQFLISPEGRRLSVEGRELRRQLKLPPETLNHLVERRLLRTDRRSDSTYYELSHDALVQPVLEGRRVQALVVGGAAVLAGGTSVVLAVLLLLFVVFGLSTEKKHDSGTIAVVIFFGAFAIFLAFRGAKWVQSGQRRRKRYSRHTPEDLTEPLPSLRPFRDRLAGWVMIVTGVVVSSLWGLAGIVGVILFLTLLITHGGIPRWLEWLSADLHPLRQLMFDHPYMEFQWWVAEYLSIGAFGLLLIRVGAKKLWPHRFAAHSRFSRIPSLAQWPPELRAAAKALCGFLALTAAVLGFFALGTCAPSWHGSSPDWINWGMVSSRFSNVCQTTYQKGWSWDEISFGLFAISLFGISIAFLYSAILEMHSISRQRSLSLSKTAQRRFVLTAVACAVVAAGFPPLLAYSIVSHEHTKRVRMQQAQAALVSRQSGPQRVGWAVGEQAEILHTEDGITWKVQNKGNVGFFNSVTFITRDRGWAVGSGGSLWRTDDGGENWISQTSGVTQDLSAIAAVAPRSAWVAGADEKILHTEDSGATWNVQNADAISGYFIAIAFPTPDSGWAAGYHGIIMHTDDGGTTWAKQKSGTGDTLNFMVFATPKSGWVAGDDGNIVHTEDAGATWTQQASGTIRDLVGIAFVSPTTGWIVGRTGTILHTEDAGRTWITQNSGTRADLLEIAFTTPQAGWAVGRGGTILHTEDGGNTWLQQATGYRTDMHSITFAKPYSVIGVRFANPQKPLKPGAQITSRGVGLMRVYANGPGEKYGLKVGDTITAVDGKPMNTDGEFVDAISVLKPGTSLQITYLREGKEHKVDIITADGLATPAH